ncbi:MAG: hypothetical protein IM550_10705 [Microcystis sp. M54BS1]|uniref:hypothetical protein n=1 Tax=unclassified Microcystis TaxID=2643300 RepID=UPI00257986BA|nr:MULTISPECIES: hypothetical protein [unclassified Microcystis]MCA2539679.1 hypothetical protein [Microcystis sp. M54BS1]MCA2596208.1 hypothetical protein [Microcystis sp. M38BS1]MCA2612848.1 hypothetical protein [Microcystis sp. M27BS1]MCA2504923.1 hypothetical protein [Microcystis sp. M62BS1]MCA2513642.1 hypothetical protein [Microcystis sp. M60BS1]
MSSRLDWRGDDVTDKAREAFKELAMLFFAENVSVISDPSAFQDFPAQDIVDTGRLRASTQVDFESPVVAVFSWSVEYAAYVHEGYVSADGRVVLGRPWTEVAIERLEPEKTFNKLFRGK